MLFHQGRNKQLIVIGILFLIIAFSSLPVYAQFRDNTNWSSIKLSTPIGSGIKFSIAPNIRLNNDLSSYQDSSVDLAFRKTFSEKWHVQLLSRTWFIPDQSGREFIWIDVGFKTPLKKLIISTRTRLHLGLDINDRSDPNYFRWSSGVSFPTVGRVEPFIAIEPWFRMNNNMQLQRLRFEPGCTVRMMSHLKLTVIYRRENSVNLIPARRINMYLITLGIEV